MLFVGSGVVQVSVFKLCAYTYVFLCVCMFFCSFMFFNTKDNIYGSTVFAALGGCHSSKRERVSAANAKGARFAQQSKTGKSEDGGCVVGVGSLLGVAFLFCDNHE